MDQKWRTRKAIWLAAHCAKNERSHTAATRHENNRWQKTCPIRYLKSPSETKRAEDHHGEENACKKSANKVIIENYHTKITTKEEEEDRKEDGDIKVRGFCR